MMYSITQVANGQTIYYCNSELYLASAIKRLSLTQGYPVKPCSMVAKRNRARDPAG